MGSNPIARSVFWRRRSQVARQRSAKPRFTGSNPVVASVGWLVAGCYQPFFVLWGGGGTADAADLKSAGVTPVWVRIPPALLIAALPISGGLAYSWMEWLQV